MIEQCGFSALQGSRGARASAAQPSGGGIHLAAPVRWRRATGGPALPSVLRGTARMVPRRCGVSGLPGLVALAERLRVPSRSAAHPGARGFPPVRQAPDRSRARKDRRNPSIRGIPAGPSRGCVNGGLRHPQAGKRSTRMAARQLRPARVGRPVHSETTPLLTKEPPRGNGVARNALLLRDRRSHAAAHSGKYPREQEGRCQPALHKRCACRHIRVSRRRVGGDLISEDAIARFAGPYAAASA